MNDSPTPERTTLGYLLLLSLTHGVVDLSAGAVMALLPAMREHFSLSYTMVGNVMLWSSLAFSLSQPIFGFISDRAQRRWLLPVSLVLGGAGLAAAGWMPNYWLMVAAVIISTLGTAAFHPEGAHAAYHLAGARRAWGMGIYTIGGNIGYALGPIYAALLLLLGGGLRGTAWAAVLPFALGAYLLVLLPAWQQRDQSATVPAAAGSADGGAVNWHGMIFITIVSILRQVITTGVATYVPFYWIDTLGNDPKTAGYVQLTYLIAGVGGTLLMAPLADRYGARRLLVLSFILLFPLQATLPFLRGWALLGGLFVTGFVAASTFAVTLVMTQSYMPRRLGLASGINLGLAFGLGGVGALLLGVVGDRWSITGVLHTVTLLVPLAAVAAMALPGPARERSAPAA